MSQDEKTKLQTRFRKMDVEKKRQLLGECLTALRTEYPHLFTRKKHWVGVYLVMKDHLGVEKTSTFMELAKDIIPANWPDELMITENVFKNMNRDLHLNGKEKEEPYYRWKKNPMYDLCEAFWANLNNRLLKEK